MAKPNRNAKGTLIDDILKNEVYDAQESGLYRRLRAALLRMSSDNLDNLKLIVDFKLQAAATAKCGHRDATEVVDALEAFVTACTPGSGVTPGVITLAAIAAGQAALSRYKNTHPTREDS